MSNKFDNISDSVKEISPALLQAFEEYYALLREFNEALNLVGSGTIKIAGERHFADCYLGLSALFASQSSSPSSVFDLGSGNGFPGLILSLMKPEVSVQLVERDQRKVQFLKHVASRLGLNNVSVLNVDVKALEEGAGKYCVSRAMAPMSRILLEARKLVPQEGHLYLFKNEYWTAEFGSLPPQLFDLWDVSVHSTYDVKSRQYFIVDCLRL